MAIVDQINHLQARDISTVALDSPLSTRTVEFVDANGNPTGDFQLQVRVFNNSGGALVLGQVVMVDYSGLVTKNPQVKTLATSTPKRDVLVAVEAPADQAWFWAVRAGYVNALVEGTTAVAVSDFLKCTTATSTTGFIKDGTTMTDTASAAIACAAQAAGGNVLTKVFLLGERKTIA